MAEVLVTTLKLLAITCPFITEHIYQQLKKKYNFKEESVHLCDWPSIDESMIDEKLERKFVVVKKVIQEILAKRNTEKIGIRWPLSKATVTTEHAHEFTDFKEIIMYQTNIKNIEFVEGKTLEVSADTKITSELEREGYCRELTRKVQALRKKAGLSKEDKIDLIISSSYDISVFAGDIQKKVGASNVSFGKLEKKYKHTAKEKIKDHTFEIGFTKA